MALGEARSKCEHVAGAALRPAEAKLLYELALTRGAHATTSIEGNTLTEEEVGRRIKGDLRLPKSREYQGRAVDNVLVAYNLIADEVAQGAISPLGRDRLREFNRLVLRGLDVGEDVVPGEIRTHSVGVAGYKGPAHQDCEGLVNELCDWLNGPGFVGESEELTFALTLVKAVVAHLYIAWIHPFGDGNGRTARLVEFQLLVESGVVPLPAAHLLSNHFNQTRDRYYRELDRSSRAGGDFVPFFIYEIDGFVDGLRSQIDLIRACQDRDLWVNYVHDEFRGKETLAATRRKHLVLDMLPTMWLTASEIQTVSVRVATSYSKKGERTIAS